MYNMDEKELDDFHNDNENDKNSLKLLIDEFDSINTEKVELETFVIKPVLSKEESIKEIDIKKELHNNNKSLF
jgi:hypothetical protein